MELQWWSIEVLDGELQSAARWRDSYGNILVESAIGHGAYEWHWHRQPWGMIFEIGFRSEDQWPSYRALPAVRAALDAVPDPVNGLLIYPGRGGTSGRPVPRRPRPIAGAGAAPIPEEPVLIELTLATTEPAPTTAAVSSGAQTTAA